MSRQRKPSKQAPKPPTSSNSRLDERDLSGQPEATNRPDLGFRAIVLLVAIIAIWLLLMPWVSAISWTSMRRFHLRTSSFLAWAIQFPIPAMYNFANRAEVDRYPPGLVDPLFDETEMRHLNHFPVRCVTFADARFRHFREGQDRWIVVETSYRGQKLETHFHAKPSPEGGHELIRLPDAEPSP